MDQHSRRRFRNRFARRRDRLETRFLEFQFLEERQLLAGLSQPFGDDVFAPGSVNAEDVIARATTQPYVPNQVVVAVRAGLTGDLTPSAMAEIDWDQWTGAKGTKVINRLLTSGRTKDQSVSLIQVDLGKDADTIGTIRALSQIDRVLWSSPNFIYDGADPRDFTPNDPSYSSQYHHTRMQNNLAWDTTLGNPAIRIGVTDDGVLLTHPDLQPNIWINPGEVANNGIDDDQNGYIDDVNGWDFSSGNNDPNPNGTSNDHGTHVAGIAAGRTNNGIGIAGTAGLATIVPLQFYAGTSSWTAAIISETYRYAADNGFQIVTTSYNVDGWVGDPVFTAGLQYMYDAGVLHFNSAGNNNQLNPARQVFEQSLFVASTDANDLKSSFSNYGTGIDLSAPGSSIYSTVLNNGYGTKSGTSMSTPNAAGAAALIWSANPGWNRDQVAAQLLFFADNIDGVNPSFAGLLGSGRANPYRAVTGVLPAPRVKSLTGLPPAGSTTQTANVNSFTVSFNQIMDPATVNTNGNFVLREAGSDTLFGTTDDQIIGLTASKTYRVGTNSITFNINGGSLPFGRYQLSLVAGGLQNPFAVALDGDANGTGGDNYLYQFNLLSNDVVIFADDFESGSLGSQWVTSTSSNRGRIRVSTSQGAASGAYAVLMDSSRNNSFSRNQATLTVDLLGVSSPTLRFFEASYFDEVHTMPTSFSTSSNTDGVAISANGTNWYRVWSPTTTQTSNVWTERTVDLAAAASAAGISLGSNFRIRFQQYDNSSIPSDGRGYDNVRITAHVSSFASGESGSSEDEFMTAGAWSSVVNEFESATAANEVDPQFDAKNLVVIPGLKGQISVPGKQGELRETAISNFVMNAQSKADSREDKLDMAFEELFEDVVKLN